ncbi:MULTISPECIES: four-carbon acid sugar kinase family protein [Bradyrhizobium]|uniref:four-carbon acid sugar kinase family protein n=1 Tax=Bradyrhizobium TaxID=374 RepID=UPI00155E8583|nr:MULTISPECIES: four-carbon acid sugar kinase family protein [Bradyrhizobium]MDD1523010.1 type III effector [Bradyrhizobium sp. WBAH30]MDD1547089.1 type III effector [Bradyrhizobium sp. WBAH41]MDD1560665.1 type III effector [Bradyrhizobium sp. WBAH23]MDD1568134.1 type III effector [Bradyrhizobium sp. WBAH33]MDD1594083.1 type III effector [Bradyrhizobium sp. WBAH42]
MTQPRYRLAFYGDDFTGSTDALEVVAFAGLRAALFLRPPSPDVLNHFRDIDVVGLAGVSRGMSPSEMTEHLEKDLRYLASLRAPIVHYKVCSTFDSSPEIGSIGRVIEIARSIFGDPVPIVGGTPSLQRYCAFGNLFARSGTDGNVYRIDRHPVMSVHPVTPMHESDLALHIGRQAALRIEKLTCPFLDQGYELASGRFKDLAERGADAILFDSTNASQLTQVGRLLVDWAGVSGSAFVVGPSGVEYALTQWWREAGVIPPPTSSYGGPAAIDQVLAVSGSASPVTALQIDAAVRAGFAEVPLDAAALLGDGQNMAAARQAVARTLSLLKEGRSVILHTARGPDDPRIGKMIDMLVSGGMSREFAKHEGGRNLGRKLGQLVSDILQEVPLKRLLLSGGDTSSQVAQLLNIDALEIESRVSPGVPLCRARSIRGRLDGLQIAFKGGQLGDEEFFKRGWLGRV